MQKIMLKVVLIAFGFSCHCVLADTESTSRDQGSESRINPDRRMPCGSGKVPMLILGTFHMDNPGQDAVNMLTDMTGEKRQREIEAVVDQLVKFAPTKIAIESSRNSTAWTDWYTQWLRSEYKMGGNEIEQIGFRLAKRLGLKRLHPVDYPMWMNGLTPNERHTPKQQLSQNQADSAAESPLMKEVRTQIERDEEMLRTGTVSQYLVFLNSPARSAMNYRWDVTSNLLPGDGDALYENTDLATNWYKRNLRIVTNLLEITEPGDRILLIIGAGHVKILSDLISQCPQYCLIDLASVLK